MHKKKFLTLTIALIIFAIAFAPSAFASSLNNYKTNNSGWIYYDSTNKIHMGQINSTYYLTSQMTTYADTFYNAADTWGYSFLTMTRTQSANSAICTIKFGTTSNDLQLVECKNYTSSNNHITHVDVVVDQALFLSLVTTGRERVFMAGIGGAYGLGFRTSGTCVMNRNCYSSNTYPYPPTANELRAIKVLTHQHTHSASSSTMSVSTYNASYHKCTCSYCHTYLLSSHNFVVRNNLSVCSICGYIAVS